MLRAVPGRARPRALSLMTFNVLAPCYFRHGGLLESADRAAFLARAQAAIRTIQREQSDVVCLQEFWFEREYQRAFRAAFRDSHYLHTIKRPGKKEDGLAVFVRKRKLDIHHVQDIQFDRGAGDRVALLMHLATKWNRDALPLAQRSLLVINSHLTFPHAEIYKEMRLEQIKLVLEQARDYIERERLDNVPVLMCGDFNDSNDPVHRLVTDQGFASVFGRVHGREARITHVNHNNREVGVDFIFGAHLHGATPTARSRVMSEKKLAVPPLPGTPSNPLPYTQHQQQQGIIYPHDLSHVVDESDPMVNYHQRAQHATDPLAPPRYFTPVDRLKLVPTGCHLLPRSLSDVVRIKRPRFAPDWSAVRHPEEYAGEDALVDYWRLVSDHRPIVATFDVLGGGGDSLDDSSATVPRPVPHPPLRTDSTH